ncbi:MAG: 50S ribosomal protein L11 methyltransferase [Bacteroidetes bacterium]|nr:50S ribosomal protein L11 methyltransferase [Bacteroidota bacterium]
MQQFIAVQIFSKDPIIKESLVALLSENGFYAFEEKEEELLAYIEKKLFDKEATVQLLRQFSLTHYSFFEIENQNWNQQWESSFEPVVVDDFAAIRASFHQPIPNVKHQIIITPKMSFGTGHHATTYLMIAQMHALDFTGKTVIDFGAGTGVLSILAEKLGAHNILALDNDEWSIVNTNENIEANQCKHIRVVQADGFIADSPAHIILANINLNVITENLPKMVSACIEGTIALFSGLLVADKEVILENLMRYNFEVKEITEKNGWICLLTIYAIG